MTKRVILLAEVVMALAFLQAVRADTATIRIRNSIDHFWNVGWDSRFVILSSWYEVRGDTVVFGPLPYLNTIEHTTIANPEIWWTAATTDEIAYVLTAKYRRYRISLRDNDTMSFWIQNKALDAVLNLYSVGGRLQLKTLPFMPYFGLDMGYCRGNLTTVEVLEIPATGTSTASKDYIHVDGSGGGCFLDIVAGCKQLLRDRISVFIEFGYLLTPDWSDFDADKVTGDINERTERGLFNVDRDIRITGPHIALGVEVGI